MQMTGDSVFEKRKNRAMAIMEGRGMWPSIYAPPCHIFLWRLGIHVPPPPFSTFWTNFFSFAVVYTPFWGIVMWFIFWKAQGATLLYAATSTLIAGLFFGVIMAAFQEWRKRANHLPAWEKL